MLGKIAKKISKIILNNTASQAQQMNTEFV